MVSTIKFWSDERITELRNCAANGMTIPEASAVFDKSQMAIRWQARDKGVRFACVRPGWTDQEDATLRNLVKEGYGWKAIGKILGKSRGCVAGFARRNGIEFIGKSKTVKRAYKHAKPTPKRTARKRRKCLGTCGRHFESAWIGNRVCNSCKGSGAYVGGAMA